MLIMGKVYESTRIVSNETSLNNFRNKTSYSPFLPSAKSLIARGVYFTSNHKVLCDMPQIKQQITLFAANKIIYIIGPNQIQLPSILFNEYSHAKLFDDRYHDKNYKILISQFC